MTWSYLGCGEIGRPSLALGSAVEDIVSVGATLLHFYSKFVYHCQGSCGVSHSTCLQRGCCATLGVKAMHGFIYMGRMGLRRDEGGSPTRDPDPCIFSGLRGEVTPSIPSRQCPVAFSAPLQSGLTETSVSYCDLHLLGLHGYYGNVRPGAFFRLKHPINTSNSVCREKEKVK